MVARLLTCALALSVLAVASSATAAEKRFALVVGYNFSDDSALKPLRYADDDALRYADLFSHATVKTVVLTQLDKETRRLVGKRRVGTPTRARLIAELKRIKQRMDAAKAKGHRPMLYFAYSGHGNYDAAGRGYVHLRGGRFTTRDLYYHLFEGFRDYPVVLIVDACNAALLVNSRGVARRRKARAHRLRLENYPNVGVILASSTVGETHEWGRFLAGIFSHEIRSGLLGPADLNGDKKITFAELAAFVAAANARVRNPTVRVRAYIRPPTRHPNFAIMDLNRARFPVRVRIGRTIRGRAHVVDSELIRYADFHKGARQTFTLALTSRKPFVIVHGDDEYVVPAGARGVLQLKDLVRRKRTVLSARGAGSDYFERTLFHQAYSRSYAQRYLQNEYLSGLTLERFELLPWYKNDGAWVALASGVGTLAVAAGYHVAAFNAGKAAEQTQWADERQTWIHRMSRRQTTAGILYGVGGAAVLTSVLLFVLNRQTRRERYKPPFSISIHPNGISLQARL